MGFKHCLLAAVLALIAFCAQAQVDGYTFRQHSPGDVLPGRINSAYQASGDCCWLCSEEGLVRLNNYRFQLYSFNSKDKKSIPGDKVYQVVKDEAGNTWVMTDGGLALWNRHLDNFTRMGINAVSALPDRGGCFFGAADTLFRYDNTTRKIAVATSFAPGTDFTINQILRWKDGTVLLCSREKGVYVYDPNTRKLDKAGALQGRSSALFVDSEGNLWRAVFGRGVECFNSGLAKTMSMDVSNSGLSSNAVCCFCEHDGNIWMGTDGGGITIFNPAKQSFTVLRHDSSDPNSIPCNSIISMFAASSGLVLAGTSKEGLVVAHRSRMISENVSDGISSVFSTSDGRLLIGTDGAGIVSYPQSNGARVVSMAELPDGRILFYNYPDGFCTIDKVSGAVRSFSFGYDPLRTSNTEIVQEVSPGPSGTIFIHNDQQLFRYNPSSGGITEFRIPKEITGYGTILQSVGGQKGKFFHNSRFVFTPDEEGNGVRTLLDFGTKSSVNALSVDQSGTLWLATSDGLAWYEAKEDTLRFVENDFIKSVRSVLCDNDGRVWAGTKSHLYYFDKPAGEFYEVDDLDGLAFNQFTPKIRLVTASGDVVMGSESAYVQIDRYYTPFGDASLEMGVELISIDGKPVERVGKFRVPASCKTIEFEASVNSSRYFDIDRMYRFRIVGPEGESVQTQNTPSISLLSPKSGRYKIYGSCSSKNAEWTEYKLLTQFRVRKHWYTSWWFMLFLGLTLLSIGSWSFKEKPAKEEKTHEPFGEPIQKSRGWKKRNFKFSLVEGPLGGPEVEQPAPPVEETFMEKFERVVRENITNPNLDVHYIVDALGTSRTVLFNRVKEATGMNLQNYINKCRMENVIELMKTTSLPLGDIAERSGFATPRYFSTAFKNFTGMTPSEYKKKMCSS